MGKMKELSSYMAMVCVHILELVNVDGTIENVIAEEQKRGIDVTADYRYSTKEGCEDGMIAHVYYCNLCKQEERHEVAIETDYIYIGECPHDEDDFSTYSSGHIASAFVLQLNNTFTPPMGARIRRKLEQGGGGYYTVVCEYSTEYPYAVAFAYMLESNMPANWSPAAKRFLEGK